MKIQELKYRGGGGQLQLDEQVTGNLVQLWQDESRKTRKAQNQCDKNASSVCTTGSKQFLVRFANGDCETIYLVKTIDIKLLTYVTGG